jgi:hypothetical protein
MVSAVETVDLLLYRWAIGAFPRAQTKNIPMPRVVLHARNASIGSGLGEGTKNEASDGSAIERSHAYHG